jgi:hypothetical protein
LIVAISHFGILANTERSTRWRLEGDRVTDEAPFMLDPIDTDGDVAEGEPPRFHRVVDLSGAYRRVLVCGCDADYYGVSCELWEESC